ncbi:MAG: hypothetical protein LUF33_04830 [Clostridiales bacterium]|nr:hypothetical protein [Clostridiales bacterium]
MPAKTAKKQFPSPSAVRYTVGQFLCAAPFPYMDIFKRAVLNFKFYNCGGYTRQLAFMTVQSINEVYRDEHFDLVTCVPMHKKQLKLRHYNQAELLAKECAEIMKIPYEDTLIKVKDNKPQHSIKASERSKNVKGAYKAKDKSLIEGKRLLIIDDIITTGCTLGECGKTLMKAGAEKVSCAAVCTVIFS